MLGLGDPLPDDPPGELTLPGLTSASLMAIRRLSSLLGAPALYSGDPACGTPAEGDFSLSAATAAAKSGDLMGDVASGEDCILGMRMDGGDVPVNRDGQSFGPWPCIPMNEHTVLDRTAKLSKRQSLQPKSVHQSQL